MEIKDYYKILELDPPASLTEIKQAYRRLAQQYHPDKNAGKEYASVYFAEIKEAYEVLTNPVKKDEYLQQRWYLQSLGIKKFSDQPVTPPIILKQLIELNQYIRSLDSFRMDKEKKFAQLSGILSDNTISSLKAFNEKDVNREITRIAMQTASYFLKYQVEQIARKLRILNQDSNPELQYIDTILAQQIKKERNEKLTPLLIILATLAICAIIYLASR